MLHETRGQVEVLVRREFKQSSNCMSSYWVSWQIIALAKTGHCFGVLRTYHLPSWNVA